MNKVIFQNKLSALTAGNGNARLSKLVTTTPESTTLNKRFIEQIIAPRQNKNVNNDGLFYYFHLEMIFWWMFSLTLILPIPKLTILIVSPSFPVK